MDIVEYEYAVEPLPRNGVVNNWVSVAAFRMSAVTMALPCVTDASATHVFVSGRLYGFLIRAKYADFLAAWRGEATVDPTEPA